MTPAQAKSITLGCLVGAGAVASVDNLSRGEWPPLRVGVGVFVGGVFLLALADSAPKLAAGFGALTLTGALLRDGIPAARRITSSF